MAKKDIQDFRVDFIESIGRTDNLKVLKSISGSMSIMDYTFDLSIQELNSILDKGVKNIHRLLGSSIDSFTPLKKIKESSPYTYFSKISEGYKEVALKEKSIIELDKKRMEYKNKIHRYKDKGRLDKAKDFESKLFALNYPTENKNKVKAAILELNTNLEIGAITSEHYMTVTAGINKLDKLSDDALKTLDGIKNTENIMFLNSMQEDIRYYLCYLFFERVGKISDSPNRFLANFEGESRIDFEHVLLMYNYLKSIDYDNLREVEGVLCYYALEQFFRDVSPFMSKKDIKGIYLRESPTEFNSVKYEGYSRGFIPAYLLPKGYRGYVFEPSSLGQQSFIAAINKDSLSINTMVQKYKDAQTAMKDKKSGIFYTFLSKDLENKLIPKLVTSEFPLNEMDGEFSSLLLQELRERRKIFGDSESFNVMTNMYTRVVKPYSLEVLGSYVRNFCGGLANLKDKGMVYIYYVSPQRIAIAVRDDVTDTMLSDIFDTSFINILKKIKKPTLREITHGDYL